MTKERRKWYLSEVGSGTIVLLLVFAIVLSFDIYFLLSRPENADELFDGVMVEAHGLLFDLALIAVVLAAFRIRRDRDLEISRYLEEIDDYRSWNEKEAAYRLAGIIRRLNKRGVHKLNLSNCHLEGVRLDEIDLSGSDLTGACFKGASLAKANLSNTTILGANFDGCTISDSDFSLAVISIRNDGDKITGILTAKRLTSGEIDQRDTGLTGMRLPSFDGVFGWQSAKLDKPLELHVRGSNLDDVEFEDAISKDKM